MEYLIVVTRLTMTFIVLLFVTVILGKRYLGELSAFDFTIAITLGAVAGSNLSDPQLPYGPTLLTILGLGLIHVMVSRIILKSPKIGRWITIEPTIVIRNGIILKKNLYGARYSLEELFSQLREKDVFDPGEVEFAILEPNGTLSVLKKSQYQPLTPNDLGLPTVYKGLAIPLVIEGRICHRGLEDANLSAEWLLDRLNALGYEGPEDLLLAVLNTRGELYISPDLTRG